MGYYINPTDRSKEVWLIENGKEIDLTAAKAHKAEGSDQRVVCLADNGPFTAAGIAYDDQERDAFARPDPRIKRWYLVSIDKLKPWWSPN